MQTIKIIIILAIVQAFTLSNVPLMRGSEAFKADCVQTTQETFLSTSIEVVHQGLTEIEIYVWTESCGDLSILDDQRNSLVSEQVCSNGLLVFDIKDWECGDYLIVWQSEEYEELPFEIVC